VQTLAEDANDSETASLKGLMSLTLSCIVAQSRMYRGKICISSAHSALVVDQPGSLIVEIQPTDVQNQVENTLGCWEKPYITRLGRSESGIRLARREWPSFH